MSLDQALAAAYGTDTICAAGQTDRYEQGLAMFRATYGPGDVAVFRVPGRVNLIGEHTDYNQGYVLPLALDRDVALYARRRKDRQVQIANMEPSFGPRIFGLSAIIPRQARGDWANYAQGPVQWLAERYRQDLCGMDVLVDGREPWGVPRGAGLSSSSALVVAFAVAMVRLNGIDLGGAELADACGQAEWYVGTRGGVMDQFIALMGNAGHALFLDCRACPDTGTYTWQPVPLPADHSLVVMDSQVKHRNTSNAFNQRVAECRIGAKLLSRHIPGLTHLRDAEDLGWPSISHLLPETMTREELVQAGIQLDAIMDSDALAHVDVFEIRKRCRHVITENARVLLAVSALCDGRTRELADLMRQAHASARDDYEISVPEVEALVDLATGVDDAIGARLTGAGWGGCVIALCPSELVPALEDELRRVGSSYLISRASHGAGMIFQTTL